jgi:hypothetical protein
MKCGFALCKSTPGGEAGNRGIRNRIDMRDYWLGQPPGLGSSHTKSDKDRSGPWVRALKPWAFLSMILLRRLCYGSVIAGLISDESPSGSDLRSPGMPRKSCRVPDFARGMYARTEGFPNVVGRLHAHSLGGGSAIVRGATLRWREFRS